jgi:hypothetical protein
MQEWAFKNEKISGYLHALGFKGQMIKVKPSQQ